MTTNVIRASWFVIRQSKLSKFALVLLAVLWLLTNPESRNTLHAAFLDNGWGARPAGMGDAFSAIADDSNAPLFNPAGITQVGRHEATFMYARLFSGLDLKAGQEDSSLGLNYFSYVTPPLGAVGSLGFSWANFQTSHLYREDTYTITYARKILPALSGGINLKILHSGFTPDEESASDPLFRNSGRTQTTFAPDLGLLYVPRWSLAPGLKLGLTGKNLTKPDVGLSSQDRLPVEFRYAVAYEDAGTFPVTASIDLVQRRGVTTFHGGIERWLFKDRLGLRAGGSPHDLGIGASFFSRVAGRLIVGIDYAFTWPLQVDGTAGSHRTSLTIYF